MYFCTINLTESEMTYSPSSPVTGSAQTGFTGPTYTLTSDVAPSQNGKQFAITALGGTQTGVDVHTVSKPFTSTFFKPANLRVLPQANPVTGIIKSIPMNVYKLVTRKGAQPASNQSAIPLRVTTIFEVPAGVDTYEPEDVRAALSCHIGLLNQQSAGIGDTLVSGLM